MTLDLVLRARSSRINSLRALTVASIIAPGLVFSAYALVSYRAAFRAAEAKAAHLSSILQEHAQRTFEGIQIALTHADQQLAELDEHAMRTSQTAWQQVKRIQNVAPQLGSIFVVAADGSNLLTTREFPPSTTSFEDRDYFVAQKEGTGGFFLGRAYMGKISSEPIFNFSIRRSGEGFSGVIGSSAKVSYFQEFYRTIGDADEDFSVVLLREDGEILARHPAIEPGAYVPPTRVALKGSLRQVSYTVSTIDGEPRVYATARVGTFPAYVAYTITEASIRKRWAEDLVLPGAVAASVGLALLLLTLFALHRAQAEVYAVNRLSAEVDRRRQAEASLLQAQKLDAVGRLTGGIAHDFNNLLMIVLGNLALAQKKESVGQIRRLLVSAQQAAQRGATLTRQLLAFSRAQTLRPEIVNLADVLDNAKTWIARAVTEAIEIRLEQQPDLWPVKMDLAQFEAALLNLVVNARDAIGGTGTLLIEARNVVVADEHNMQLAPGDYVCVSVADNGAGMSPDVLARVFEPFFTTKDVGKGTGLGLSQVHGFIRQSGGAIDIQSRPGQGTTVTLYLPRSELAPPPPSSRTPQMHVENEPARVDSVVLVVEDDEEVRRLTVRFLDELGYSSVSARTAEEALALLSAGERIDVLFTDAVLPRAMGGDVLARRALLQRPSLSILITSASLELTSSFPILPKPFTREGLGQALERRQKA
jgi:two-component system, NtrC family, sensor kinase